MKEQLESKKMTAPKLEVIRFQNEDVISASQVVIGPVGGQDPINPPTENPPFPIPGGNIPGN